MNVLIMSSELSEISPLALSASPGGMYLPAVIADVSGEVLDVFADLIGDAGESAEGEDLKRCCGICEWLPCPCPRA